MNRVSSVREKMKNFGKGSAGFTLIELMIVVAIVGLIVGLAIPNYNEYTKKARRNVAQGDLVALSAAVERYFSQRFSYTGVTAALVYNDVSPADGPDADANYNTAVVLIPDAANPTGFYVTAAPIGGQAGDGALAYSPQGFRCHFDSDTVPADPGNDGGCNPW